MKRYQANWENHGQGDQEVARKWIVVRFVDWRPCSSFPETLEGNIHISSRTAQRRDSKRDDTFCAPRTSTSACIVVRCPLSIVKATNGIKNHRAYHILSWRCDAKTITAELTWRVTLSWMTVTLCPSCSSRSETVHEPFNVVPNDALTSVATPSSVDVTMTSKVVWNFRRPITGIRSTTVNFSGVLRLASMRLAWGERDKRLRGCWINAITVSFGALMICWNSKSRVGHNILGGRFKKWIGTKGGLLPLNRSSYFVKPQLASAYNRGEYTINTLDNNQPSYASYA